MDPATAIALAGTAYQAIRKGFAVSKEVHSMTKEIGQFMNAIETIKKGHETQKKKYGSVEEQALETYAAQKKAAAMEAELRNWLIAHYGMNAWQDVLRIQGQIRKARLAERERKRKQLEWVLEWLAVSCLTAIGVAVLGYFIYFLMSLDG